MTVTRHRGRWQSPWNLDFLSPSPPPSPSEKKKIHRHRHRREKKISPSPSPPNKKIFTVTVTVKYIFYHHDYSEKYFIEFTNLNIILSVNGPNIGSTNFNDESSHELVNNTNDIQFLPRKDRDQRCLSRSYRRYKKSFDLDLKIIWRIMKVTMRQKNLGGGLGGGAPQKILGI